MKKKALILLTLLICFSNKVFAVCETPDQFKTAFELFDQRESEAFKTTTKNIVTSLMDVMTAINKETSDVMQSFIDYSAQKAAYMDAMNQSEVVRNRQQADAKNQTEDRAPDINDFICAKAGNSGALTTSREISAAATDAHINSYLVKSNKQQDQFTSANEFLDEHILRFSKYTDKGDSNPALNWDLKPFANELTFTDKIADDDFSDPDTMPDTLVAAAAFSQNAIGNKGMAKTPIKEALAKDQKVLALAKEKSAQARKNLAFAPFAKMMGDRTTVKNSKTGDNVRAQMAQMGALGIGAGTTAASQIPNDVSKRHLDDIMYSQMLMNPDWLLSLEGRTEKQLKIEKLDLVNRNLALEWDTLLSLEMLATIEGANLATTIDNSGR